MPIYISISAHIAQYITVINSKGVSYGIHISAEVVLRALMDSGTKAC